MSDLVSKKVKIAPPRKPEEVDVVNSTDEDSSDDEFEVRIKFLEIPVISGNVISLSIMYTIHVFIFIVDL